MEIEQVPIPLFSTPLESVNNPVLVVFDRARVCVEVDTTSETSVYLETGFPRKDYYNLLAEYIRSFLEPIASEVLGDKGLYVGINGFYPYALGLYALVTTRVLEEMGLEGNELLDIASSLDKYTGLYSTVLEGLRRAIITGKPLVYRHGEEPVILDYKKLAGLETRVSRYTRVTSKAVFKGLDSIRTAIIHLTGYSIIEFTRCILPSCFMECIDLFYNTVRVYNAVYYIVYGVNPPIDSVYIADIEGYVSIARIGGDDG